MSKIFLEANSRITLSGLYRGNLPADLESEFIMEHSEHGLSLHYARLDAQRAYLEVTTGCNLDCQMCVRHSWRDELGSMSSNTFQAVLNGLRSFPDLKRVFFGGYGEPLLHPHVVDMVEQIHALGIGVTMTTNGLLLNRKLAEKLFRAGLDTLVVSLDSQHLQAHDQIRGKSGLNTVLDNIRDVNMLIRDSGWKLPALGLEYVATRSNLDELYKLPSLAKEIAAGFIIVTNLLPHTPEMAHDILYDQDKPLHLGGGWGYHRAGWVAWGTPRVPRMKWGAVRRCRFVNEPSFVVGWDGQVSPCYALMHSYTYYIYGRRKQVSRYTLGSVLDQPLDKIWKSEEYVLFRAVVRDFRFPSCVDCGMDCSYAQENIDCWGNEPSCADCLWAQDIILCP